MSDLIKMELNKRTIQKNTLKETQWTIGKHRQLKIMKTMHDQSEKLKK